MVNNKLLDIYFEPIAINKWFSETGNLLHKKELIPKDCKAIESLAEAVLLWDKDTNLRCKEWEYLRVQLLDTPEWIDSFSEVRNYIDNKLKQHQSVVDFGNLLMSEFQIELDSFLYSLPIIGGWGEHLLQIESGYYQSQLKYFNAGFWLCKTDVKQLVCY